ncbi:MAG: hypothetical protein ACE5I9_05150 [Candidatus Methylomirabilales bacterium]
MNTFRPSRIALFKPRYAAPARDPPGPNVDPHRVGHIPVEDAYHVHNKPEPGRIYSTVLREPPVGHAGSEDDTHVRRLDAGDPTDKHGIGLMSPDTRIRADNSRAVPAQLLGDSPSITSKYRTSETESQDTEVCFPHGCLLVR